MVPRRSLAVGALAISATLGVSTGVFALLEPTASVPRAVSASSAGSSTTPDAFSGEPDRPVSGAEDQAVDPGGPGGGASGSPRIDDPATPRAAPTASSSMPSGMPSPESGTTPSPGSSPTPTPSPGVSPTPTPTPSPTIPPPPPVLCAAGSTAQANDGYNDIACLPNECLELPVLPDPAFPQCDETFRP